MGTYRGLNISGGLRANFKKLRVKKTIDEMEISDRGAITGTPSDLTTRGAAHRRGRGNNQRKGASGATRESVDYGFITGAGSNIIQEHDYGTVVETTTSLSSAAFETRRALGFAASIADEETAVAPTAALPGSVSLYNSTGIIPAGAPLILNEDGTVSAVTGGSYQGAGLSTTYDNPNSSGDLGRSASISDTYVAATDANSGTVSIFNRETGIHIRTHTKSADSSSRWGWYVDNSDDYVVVGDASPDYSRQVLDVWRLSDGASMTTIYHPTNGNNMFPGSVAINGNKILAGAYQGVDENNLNTGAYLWNAQNGSLLRSYSRDIADAFHFGRAVTMNSTYAFVFSPRWYPQSLGYDEVPAKIHMFTFTSDNAVQRYPISWFGGSSQAELDCDETHVIIGGAGKAGIIDIATGNLVREFVPPEGEAGSAFGLDVSIDGDYAAVSGSGKVFVYDVTTGDVLATFQDPDGNALTFYQQVIRARSNGDILVANRSAANGGKVYKYTIGEIQTTNLTEDNYIGFAGTDFPTDGALGQVITGGGTVTGLSGLTIGADYYVQNDGTISTTVTNVFAGTATSSTTLELPNPTSWYGDRGIAVFGSGGTAIEYFNIPTPAATSTTFGNLTSIRRFPATGSNGTYGVAVAGYNIALDDIDYFAIATPGAASNFGLTTRNISYTWGSSDGTTMFYGSGAADGGGVQLEHITIGTSGTATQFISAASTTHFGHALSNANKTLINGLTSTRTEITYFNNLTAILAQDWGDLVVTTHWQRVGASNETYGLYAGGNQGSTWAHQRTNAIDYVAIDTLGQAGSFGTLSETKNNMCTSSNGTLAAFAGGQRSSSTDTRTIEYVNIGTSGTASDWGDLIGIFTEGRPGNGQIAGNPA